ncbi:hypothetical protein U9M48_007287, partial [Paspalum notatum var. saurae]
RPNQGSDPAQQQQGTSGIRPRPQLLFPNSPAKGPDLPPRSPRLSLSLSLRRLGAAAAAALRQSPGMGLWTLLEGFLLLANALAILNEDRFLAPRGWSMSEVSGNGQTKSLKGQIVGLIYATQFLRMPLIALNVLIIVVKLISG